MQRLEPVITGKVEILCHGIRGCYERGEVVQLDAAYMALTLDVITGYCFGNSWGALENPDSWRKWHRVMYEGFEAAILDRHLPWLVMLMATMPIWLTEKLNPDIATFVRVKGRVQRRAALLKREHDIGEKDNQEWVNVFEEVFKSDIPTREKELDYLTDNAFVLVAAGGDTSARLLTNLAYHVLANENILKRLKGELNRAIPNAAILPAWRELEELPYLRAIIKESLRIGGLLTTRLTQVASDEDLKYEVYSIPRGVREILLYTSLRGWINSASC